MSNNLVNLSGVSKSYDGSPLISAVSFGVDARERVGVIGANGSGKSTILKLIAGQESPDTGRIARRRDARIAFLPQSPLLEPGRTIRDTVALGMEDLLVAITAYETAARGMNSEASALLDRVEQLGGWDTGHRVEQAASALGFGRADLDRTVGSLSGGQARRVALAQLVVQQPDLVLVDEPTNHLDAETVDWLEEWLKATNAAVVLVTHDRYLLDAVVDRMLELRGGVLTGYAGTYTDYVAARAIEEAHREKTQHRRLRGLMSELEWARRSPSARTTKSRARLERIEHAQEEVKRLTGRPFAADLALGAAPRTGGRILDLDEVSTAFPDQPPLFKDLTMQLVRGDRIGILGPNGCGKTTLLRLIIGELVPSGGDVRIGHNTQVAYLDQQRRELRAGATVREIVCPEGADVVAPSGGRPVRVESWLERFGFGAALWDRSVDTLSGGERSRLALARFMLERANLLILDEPTNDLDIPTLRELEEALLAFEGCVLIVTHDRFLLDRVATGIVAFEEPHFGPGAVSFVRGGYSHYRSYLKGRLIGEDGASPAAAGAEAKRTPKQDRAMSAGKKRLTYAEEIELRQIEPKIDRAQKQADVLEQDLAEPGIWGADPERAKAIQRALKEARAEVAALFERWEVLLRRMDESA